MKEKLKPITSNNVARGIIKVTPTNTVPQFNATARRADDEEAHAIIDRNTISIATKCLDDDEADEDTDE